jgi:hypothetical protein
VIANTAITEKIPMAAFAPPESPVEPASVAVRVPVLVELLDITEVVVGGAAISDV